MVRNKPYISIIIATKNEAENLPKLLASLNQQTYNNFEIIVVDNFSTDATQSIAQLFQTKLYMTGDERSAQRNFGTKHARGQFLLFLDADMLVPPQMLAHCIKLTKRKKVHAIIIPETVKITNWFSKIKKLEKKIYENEESIEAPRFFSKSMFKKIGGYDEMLVAGEDWDLGIRVRKFTKIDRMSFPLYHQEISLLRDLQHKYYYAHRISHYKTLHSTVFSKQGEWYRIHLFWKKRNLLWHHPITTLALILLKASEYILYKIVSLLKL